MSDEPHPDQTLPGDLEDPDDPKTPKGDPPRGPGQNRGKDEEARRNAPGQNKEK